MRPLTYPERNAIEEAADTLEDTGYPTAAKQVRDALNYDWEHRTDSADASDEFLETPIERQWTAEEVRAARAAIAKAEEKP